MVAMGLHPAVGSRGGDVAITSPFFCVVAFLPHFPSSLPVPQQEAALLPAVSSSIWFLIRTLSLHSIALGFPGGFDKTRSRVFDAESVGSFRGVVDGTWRESH
ncbi:hypothetical protein NITLEN_80029 [Nitrospira lenta]|uniref:Uncharacterized protein n=1 Tax=Nitrospira lenta TaxID=1436998 RepID=A0A330LA41_9BACT|nr:hypothetical protein NITLEN_80029 [Nitrospira lenta]